ncbi:RNA-binding protein Raly-like [Salvia splendens]|uniref:RNA-binding protein Raly-like n=1 Tax=Salvia splendens TaxID=180675 RepID=UPI001C26991D|nr:RNA-binding protein Raly-like [Salvia splendens]
MPKALPVLPYIPAAPSPRLNAVAIILAINPITFIPHTHVIVINPTATTFPLMKLALIDIPIDVCLNITPGNDFLIRLLPRTNRPKHRKMRPAHPTLDIYLNRQGLGKEQPNRGEPQDCYCGGGGGGGGGGDGGAGGGGGGGNGSRISETYCGKD